MGMPSRRNRHTATPQTPCHNAATQTSLRHKRNTRPPAKPYHATSAQLGNVPKRPSVKTLTSHCIVSHTPFYCHFSLQTPQTWHGSRLVFAGYTKSHKCLNNPLIFVTVSKFMTKFAFANNSQHTQPIHPFSINQQATHKCHCQ